MKKIIDRNGRLFGFISVIDLLVIVVVAVMGFALYTKNTQMAITSTTANKTGTIIYFLIYIFLWYVPDYNASRNISPTVG